MGIGFLSDPLYDVEYPASAVFGLAAYVLAHEIGHTFGESATSLLKQHSEAA